MATLSVAQPPSQHAHSEKYSDPSGLKVQWGTQDTLWPISKAAKSANATSRLGTLATPKQNFQTEEVANRDSYIYSCGRGSIIWGVRPGALQASPSPRIENLAQPKPVNKEFSEKADRPNFVFSCGRVSPIWSVRGSGNSTTERPRTTDLARPRSLHPLFQPGKEVQTLIPKPALTAKSTDRLDSLSLAKNRSAGQYRDPMWAVSDMAKKSQPSPRCVELSRTKAVAEGFMSARDPLWPVSRPAKLASATSRLEELSKPIVRATMDHLQYDPEAFIVKENALKAKCSKRLEELSQPITR